MSFRTDAVQAGVYADSTYHSVTTPIYTSSTFFFERLGELPRFDYSRSGNPTRHALEQNLAALEGGTSAVITATGMAAVTTAMFLFKPGDHIIVGKDIYGGTVPPVQHGAYEPWLPLLLRQPRQHSGDRGREAPGNARNLDRNAKQSAAEPDGHRGGGGTGPQDGV
jgi:hypothetical protein